jgi:hypothetical protein
VRRRCQYNDLNCVMTRGSTNKQAKAELTREISVHAGSQRKAPSRDLTVLGKSREGMTHSLVSRDTNVAIGHRYTER